MRLMGYRPALLLTTALLAKAQGTFDWSSIPGSQNLSWVDCYSSPFQCTRFNVPLNYSDSAAGTATLALIRIPSSLSNSSAYRGPVLYNPGGPGGGGIDAVLLLGGLLAQVIGPEFDLVSFDPRGVANSVPKISFFKTDLERAAFDFSANAVDLTSFPDNIPTEWVRYQVLGHLAQDRDNGVLAHVTTDNVARDMLRIAEAHGESKLKYWGMSYGTALGATFASLFPDKIERIVLDGVVDTEAYYRTDWTNELADTDKTLQMFFDGCFEAGPDACAFFANSSAAIEANLNALYDQVAAQPVVAYSPSQPQYGIVDHATLKVAVLISLYSPYISFPLLAQALVDLRTGNGTALLQLVPSLISEELSAIACSDGIAVNDDVQALKDYTQSIANLSSFAGAAAAFRVTCSGWRIHPNNFKGPIMGNTSFPLLIVGNTADPVTPLVNAKKTSTVFPGSVVLTQDSPGHSSFAIMSNCTQGYIRQYFQNGTLPDEGTICPVSGKLFLDSNITSII